MLIKFLRKPGLFPLLIGVLLIFLSGYLYLGAVAGATLRCHECNCRYALNAENPFCRSPAILALWFYATVSGAIVSFITAWYRRRRAKGMM